MKYIDLAEKIAFAFGLDTGIVKYYMKRLDEFAAINPDQVPGQTITESEFRAICGRLDLPQRLAVASALTDCGITVVPDPDPEPTNAGHDRDWWVENANVNDAEDCEACEGDLCPVHYGISMGIDLMAKKIAALGDDPELFALIPDPVKAPGVDDE